LVSLAACGGTDIPFAPDGGDPGGPDAAILPLVDAAIDATREDASPPPCPTRACVTSARDESGGCVDTPVADGTACDDGDACTAGDGCQAGACSGTAIAQEGAVHGQVSTFGGEPLFWRLEGAASFVADDRAVFLESNSMSGGQLTLVAVDDGGLTRLDEADSSLAFSFHLNSVVYWSDEPLTYVLPMGPERFVVFASDPNSLRAGMQLFGFAGDALELRGTTPLPSLDFQATMTAVGAAANDQALYACGQIGYERRLRTYLLDEATQTFALTDDQPVRSGGCTELAMSPDGTRLYMAANGGYRVYDVTDPATPVHEQVVIVKDHYLGDIAVGDDHVAVVSAGVAGDLDAALVFDRAGTLLGPVHAPAAGQRPFGLAVDGDRLFVQWTGGGPSLLAVHDLADVAGQPLAVTTLTDGVPGTTISPRARAGRVLLQPWRRAFQGDGLEELTGLGHGSLRTLVSSPDGTLLGLGATSRHVVDVTDPDHPALASGGALTGPAHIGFELLGARVVTPTTDGWDGFVQEQNRETFRLLDATGTAVGAGTVDGQRVNAAFAYGAHGLFQVLFERGDLRVRRYVTDDLIGRPHTPWPIQLDRQVRGVDIPNHPRGWNSGAAISASGEELIVLTLRISEDRPVAHFEYAASWLRIGQDDVTVLADGIGMPNGADVVLMGDQAYVLNTDRVVRLRREGSKIVVAGTLEPDGNMLFRRILAVDGDRLLLARHAWVGEGETRRHRYSLDVVGAGDMSIRTVHEMPDEPLSVTIVGSRYYVGTNSGMVVVTPECSVPSARSAPTPR
jgi:hypothetical protein